jgi:hypothetical protein
LETKLNSQLSNLAGPTGPLHVEAADAAEFDGLVRSARARLADAQKTENSLESRFDLAYNAAHAYCLAALRHAGFRAKNRYVVFQTLPHTLALGPEVWRVLDKAHQVRNRGEYEGEFDIDTRLLADLITACKAVEKATRKLPRLS